MKRTQQCATALAALAMLSACSDDSPSPTKPSGTPRPTGAITLTTDPPAGATLSVSQCPGEENFIPCARDLRMTFLVVVDRDIHSARVWTEFFTATGQLCGGASTDFEPLTAGMPTTLIASEVGLAFLGAPTPQCTMPVQTTRIVAHLLDRAGGLDLLTQEFVQTYTFKNP